MRMQAAPRIKRASTEQDERVAVLALSPAVERQPKSCRRIPQPFK
jgi:hypothetical protein